MIVTVARYVHNLEVQLAETRELLHKLATRLSDQESRTSTSQELKISSPSSSSPGTAPSVPSTALHTPSNADDAYSSDDEIATSKLVFLEATLKKLCLGPAPPQFLGKSSSLDLCLKALDAKQEYVNTTTAATHGTSTTSRPPQRPRHLLDNQWFMHAAEQQQYPVDSFPEFELMDSLVDLYFINCNTYTPLLHRQTFEQGIHKGLHLRDEGFASTVLLVCAIGSKFSDDPRVFTEPGNAQSAGWKYFNLVQATRKAIKLSAPTLYDVQVPCVSLTLARHRTSIAVLPAHAPMH